MQGDGTEPFAPADCRLEDTPAIKVVFGPFSNRWV